MCSLNKLSSTLKSQFYQPCMRVFDSFNVQLLFKFAAQQSAMHVGPCLVLTVFAYSSAISFSCILNDLQKGCWILAIQFLLPRTPDVSDF